MFSTIFPVTLSIFCAINSQERPADFLHLRGRDILTVLQESLEDHAHIGNPQNAVRYKLIIDPSEDDSLIRYLFKYRVLQRQQTLTYTCSDLFGEIEKVKQYYAGGANITYFKHMQKCYVVHRDGK